MSGVRHEARSGLVGCPVLRPAHEGVQRGASQAALQHPAGQWGRHDQEEAVSNKQEATYGPIPDADEMTYEAVRAVARREVAHDIEHLVTDLARAKAEIEQLRAYQRFLVSKWLEAQL